MKNHLADLARRTLEGSVLSTVLLLSSTTLAQEGTDSSGGFGTTSDSELDIATAPPSSGDGAASDPALGDSDAAAGGQVSATDVTPVAESGASKPEDVAKPQPPPLALEILPAEAYPRQPLPGIRGGSLGFVMSGLQWPYMPSYGPGQPRLRIGFSGSSWVDTNVRMVRPGRSAFPDVTDVRVQGRLTLRFTPVYNFDKDWFAQSRIEFVGITEQQHEPGKYVDLDEAWIRVGRWNRFDATVGRTQGFEVYHFGMGLDINTQEREGARASVGTTVQQAYAVSDLWDRGINNGAMALHWYAPQWLRLELLGRMGIAGTGNDIGVRPAAILDFGFVKVKGAFEKRRQWQSTSDDLRSTDTTGYGGSVNFVFDPWIEFGGGAAQRILDNYNTAGAPDVFASSTTTTWGGFLNVRPYFENWLVGVGYHNTGWENFNYEAGGRPENQTHEQMFAALQYQAWDVFFIKYVIAYSKLHVENRNDSDPNDFGYSDQQISHRLRFMLLF